MFYLSACVDNQSIIEVKENKTLIKEDKRLLFHKKLAEACEKRVEADCIAQYNYHGRYDQCVCVSDKIKSFKLDKREYDFIEQQIKELRVRDYTIYCYAKTEYECITATRVYMPLDVTCKKSSFQTEPNWQWKCTNLENL